MDGSVLLFCYKRLKILLVKGATGELLITQDARYQTSALWSTQRAVCAVGRWFFQRWLQGHLTNCPLRKYAHSSKKQ